MNKLNHLLLLCAATLTVACSDSKSDEPDAPEVEATHGLFVVNEGTYGTPSASLSFINTSTGQTSNGIFNAANGYVLGDDAVSMTIVGNTGWICVSNSNVVYAIDTDTYREVGRIDKDITQPRYVCLVGDNKLYVTQMYTNTIAVVDTKTCAVTKQIDVPQANASLNGGSTEQILKIGNYAYVNCWSYQRELVKIDVATDKVVASLDLGVQPKAMAYDGSETLWVLVDGGSWEGNPAGYEAPSIVTVDLASFTVSRTVTLQLGSYVSSLNYYDGDLYWLDNGVQRMSTTATQAPDKAFISTDTPWSMYGLTINPANGDIYVSDALDYVQSGVVYRYDNTGNLLGNYPVGICPAGFCWK